MIYDIRVEFRVKIKADSEEEAINFIENELSVPDDYVEHSLEIYMIREIPDSPTD